MSALSARQAQLMQRDQAVMHAARDILLERGYYGLTMEAIAERSGCRKGTLYGRFSSKEDVIVALATDAMKRRTEMMVRGASYDGRARERILGVGEGASLFARLNPGDSRILHTATGVIRERASPERLFALSHEEGQQVSIVSQVLTAAVVAGDLQPESEETVQEIGLGTWGLFEGALSLIEMEAPQALGMKEPLHKVWRVFNRLADAYGWRPLFNEWDYEASLASLRRAVFPEEAQKLYGEGAWYGDRA